MPDRRSTIGVTFDVKGSSQYTRQLQRAIESNVQYGRSLPIQQMSAWNAQVQASGTSASETAKQVETFSNILVRAERSAKRSRLGFTQFRKNLSPKELTAYSTEVGRLDHLLGSVNRTLRTTNQSLADRGLDRLNLDRVFSNTDRHLNTLRLIRKQLRTTFDSKEANEYVRSLDAIQGRLEQVRGALSIGIATRNARTSGRGSEVDIAQLSRDLSFPREIEPENRSRRRFTIPRSRGLDNVRFNRGLREDITSTITSNNRQLKQLSAQLHPLEQTAERTASNLQRISQGGREALILIRNQRLQYEQLAAQGSEVAQARIQALKTEETFVRNAVAIREQEAREAKESLDIAKIRTADSRLRLEQENQTLQTYGKQRSLLQNLGNLGKQTVVSTGEVTKVNSVIRETGKVIESLLPTLRRVGSRFLGGAILGGGTSFLGNEFVSGVEGVIEGVVNRLTGVSFDPSRFIGTDGIGQGFTAGGANFDQGLADAQGSFSRRLLESLRPSSLTEALHNAARGVALNEFAALNKPEVFGNVAGRVRGLNLRVPDVVNTARGARGLELTRRSLVSLALSASGVSERSIFDDRFGKDRTSRALSRQISSSEKRSNRAPLTRALVNALGSGGDVGLDDFTIGQQIAQQGSDTLNRQIRRDRKPLAETLTGQTEGIRFEAVRTAVLLKDALRTLPGVIAAPLRAVDQLAGNLLPGYIPGAERAREGIATPFARAAAREVRREFQSLATGPQEALSLARGALGIQIGDISGGSLEDIDRIEKRFNELIKRDPDTFIKFGEGQIRRNLLFRRQELTREDGPEEDTGIRARSGRVRERFQERFRREGTPSEEGAENRALISRLQNRINGFTSRFQRDRPRVDSPDTPQGSQIRQQVSRLQNRLGNVIGRSRGSNRENVAASQQTAESSQQTAQANQQTEGSIQRVAKTLRSGVARVFERESERIRINAEATSLAYEKARQSFRVSAARDNVQATSRELERFDRESPLTGPISLSERARRGALRQSIEDKLFRRLVKQEETLSSSREATSERIASLEDRRARFRAKFVNDSETDRVSNVDKLRGRIAKVRDRVDRAAAARRVASEAKARENAAAASRRAEERAEANNRARERTERARERRERLFGTREGRQERLQRLGRFRVARLTRQLEQAQQRLSNIPIGAGARTTVEGEEEERPPAQANISKQFRDATKEVERLNKSLRTAQQLFGFERIVQSLGKVSETLPRTNETLTRTLSIAGSGTFVKFASLLSRLPLSADRLATALLNTYVVANNIGQAFNNRIGPAIRSAFSIKGIQRFGSLLARGFGILLERVLVNNILYLSRQLPVIIVEIFNIGRAWTRAGFRLGRLVLGVINLKNEITGLLGSLPGRFAEFIRGPDGFLDRLRSADVQVEKLDARLRNLGRGLAAPTERLLLARSKFELVEAETNQRLAQLNKNIEELDTSKKTILDLTNQNRLLREQQLNVVNSTIAFTNAAAAAAQFEQESKIEQLPDDIDEISDNLDELRSKFEALNEIEGVQQLASQIEAIGVNSVIASRVPRGELPYSLLDQAVELRKLGNQIEKITEENGKQIEQYKEASKIIEESKNNVERTLKAQKAQRLETEAAIAFNKLSIDQEKARSSRRKASFKAERLTRQAELADQRRLFQIEQANFNVAKASANVEKTKIDIRKTQLNQAIELGNTENSFAAALGETLRGFNAARQEDITRPLGDVENAAQNANRGLDVLNSSLANVGQTTANANIELDKVDETLEKTHFTLRERIASVPNTVRSTLSDVKQEATLRIAETARAVRNITSNVAVGTISIVQGGLNRISQLGIRILDFVVKIPAQMLSVVPIIGGLAQGITDIFRYSIAGIGELTLFLTRQITAIVTRTAKNIVSTLAGIVQSLGNTITIVLSNIITTLSQLITSAAQSVFVAFSTLGTAIINVYKSLFDTISKYVGQFVNNTTNLIAYVIGRMERLLNIIANLAINIIRLPVETLINLLKIGADVIAGAFEGVREIVEGLGRLIRHVIINPLETIATLITAPIRALGFVLNALTFRNLNFGQQGEAVGEEYHKGIGRGIDRPLDDDQVPQFLRTVKAASPPKAGPFKNTDKWGEATGESWGEGFAKGVQRTDIKAPANQINKELQSSLGNTAGQTGATGVSNNSQTVFGRREIQANNDLIRAQNNVTKATTNNLNIVEKATQSLSQRATTAIQSISDIFRVLSSEGQTLGGVVDSLRTSFSNLSLGAVGALALIGGAIAGTIRAANFKGIILGFQQTGASLDALREAAAGTVDDISLMTSANLALAGATTSVRDALSRDLPTILEIARGQAVRTGQSVSFLFESLTTGIKRASPRLIDNTGLVIRIGEAYDRMAERLGKSRQELTASDTQLAILEETVRAGTQSIQELDSSTEGAAQKLERFRSTITNTINVLAFGAQPALESILDAINSFLAVIQNLAKQIAGFIFAATTVAFSGIRKFLNDVGKSTQTFVVRLFEVIGLDIGSALSQVSDFLKSLFFGLVSVFGGVAGAVAGIWETILQTIFKSLQQLSKWLIGASPPPEGPLSDIDKGGEATAKAWLEGFVGVGVTDIEEYAGDINDIINNIFSRTGIPDPSKILDDTFEEAQRRFGSFSVDQLEARLKELDRAIVPFETRLGIIREHFDAIQETTQTSLDAINRRIDTLLQAVAEGDEAAAAEVRRLDALYSRIQLGNALESQRLDNAAISIGLARAQQAEERALLEIELRRRQLAEQYADEAGSTGGGSGDDSEGVDADQFPDLIPLDQLFPELLLPEGTEELTADALKAFEEAYNNARDFVTGNPIGARFTDEDFDSLGITDPSDRKNLNLDLGQSAGNIVERFFSSIPRTLEELPDNVKALFEDVRSKILEILSAPIFDSIERFVERIFGLEEGSVDFSISATNLFNLFFVTIPQAIARTINATTEKLGINAFITKIFGLEDFDAGTFLLGLPASILGLPGRIITAWETYVRRVNIEQAQGNQQSFVDRFIASLFNDDFTLDVGAAITITWDYLTGDAEGGPGSSLRADIRDAWENRPAFGDILKDLGITGEDGILAATTTLVADIALSFADIGIRVISGTVRFLQGVSGIGSQGGEDDGPGLGSIALRLLASALGAPFVAAAYVLTTPFDQVFSIENFIAYITGIDNFTFGGFTGAADTFLAETLPNAIADTIASAALNIPIISSIEAFFADLSGSENFSFEQSFSNAYASIQNLREQIHEALTGERLPSAFPGVTDFEGAGFDIGDSEEFVSAGPPEEIAFIQQIVAGITEGILSIPEGIRQFLADNPNLLNIDAILTAALGKETTLIGIFDSLISTFEGFAANPLETLGTIVANFRTGLIEWASDEGNGLVSAINALRSFITNDENFDIGNVVTGALDIVDSIGRSIRSAFGVRTIEDFLAEGIPAREATEAASSEQGQNLGQALLSGFQSLWLDAVSYVNQNPNNFSLVDSFLQFITGNEELSVQGIVNEINNTLASLREESLEAVADGGGSISSQVFNNLAELIFGRDIVAGEVPQFLLDWVIGIPERLSQYFAEVSSTGGTSSFTGLLRAFLNDEEITPEQIIPNIISVIRQIPQVIFDTLANTTEFGEVAGFETDYISRTIANASGGDSLNEDTHTITLERTRAIRVASLNPLFQRIIDSIIDQATAFFNEHPIGEGITNAMRWFSGDEDFSFDNFARGLVNLLTTESGEERNAIIQKELEKHPNLFGLDSLVQFFTGDNELTLASLFPQLVTFFSDGEGADTLTGQLRNLVDTFTGNIRASETLDFELSALQGGDPDPNEIVGNSGNIFIRAARAITTSIDNAFNTVRDFFAERAASGQNFLGLDNLISALSGGEYETVNDWLQTFSGGLNEQNLEPIQNLPDLFDRIFTTIRNLFTRDVTLHDGEAGGPFDAIFETLEYQLNTDNADSIAGRLQQFAETMQILFTVTLPASLSVFHEALQSLVTVMLELQRAFPQLRTDFFFEEQQRRDTSGDVERFLEGLVPDGEFVQQFFDNTGFLYDIGQVFSLDNPVVQEAISRAGTDTTTIATALAEEVANTLSDPETFSTTSGRVLANTSLAEILQADVLKFAELDNSISSQILLYVAEQYKTLGSDIYNTSLEELVNGFQSPIDTSPATGISQGGFLLGRAGNDIAAAAEPESEPNRINIGEHIFQAAFGAPVSAQAYIEEGGLGERWEGIGTDARDIIERAIRNGALDENEKYADDSTNVGEIVISDILPFLAPPTDSELDDLIEASVNQTRATGASIRNILESALLLGFQFLQGAADDPFGSGNIPGVPIEGPAFDGFSIDSSQIIGAITVPSVLDQLLLESIEAEESDLSKTLDRVLEKARTLGYNAFQLTRDAFYSGFDVGGAEDVAFGSGQIPGIPLDADAQAFQDYQVPDIAAEILSSLTFAPPDTSEITDTLSATLNEWQERGGDIRDLIRQAFIEGLLRTGAIDAADTTFGSGNVPGIPLELQEPKESISLIGIENLIPLVPEDADFVELIESYTQYYEISGARAREILEIAFLSGFNNARELDPFGSGQTPGIPLDVGESSVPFDIDNILPRPPQSSEEIDQLITAAKIYYRQFGASIRQLLQDATLDAVLGEVVSGDDPFSSEEISGIPFDVNSVVPTPPLKIDENFPLIDEAILSYQNFGRLVRQQLRNATVDALLNGAVQGDDPFSSGNIPGIPLEGDYTAFTEVPTDFLPGELPNLLEQILSANLITPQDAEFNELVDAYKQEYESSGARAREILEIAFLSGFNNTRGLDPFGSGQTPGIPLDVGEDFSYENSSLGNIVDLITPIIGTAAENRVVIEDTVQTNIIDVFNDVLSNTELGGDSSEVIGAGGTGAGSGDKFYSGGARASMAWLTGFLNSFTAGYATFENAAYEISQLFVGESPPPLGPLSNLATGGEAAALSWVEAFADRLNRFFAIGSGDSDDDEGSGTLQLILNKGQTATEQFANNLPEAFNQLPSRMWDVLGSPMVKLFNYLIEAYNDFINSIANSTGALSDELDITPIVVPNASEISTKRPGFLGAQTGGTFGPGGLIVGERGPELIVPAERISVFPNHVTKDLSQINGMLQGQYQRPIYGQTTYNTYNTTDDHSTHVRIDGRGRSDDNLVMKLRASQMRRY